MGISYDDLPIRPIGVHNLEEGIHKDVNAVLVEVVEEVGLLALVDTGQHVLDVQQGSHDSHQLHRRSHRIPI